jgi:short-subunit dehydrogenase
MLKPYGKWALITGASSGIGEEFAKRLAAEKFSLIIIARREDRLQSLAKLLREKEGIEVKVIPGDLTDLNFIERIKNECSGLEIGLLINNAGFGSTGEFINCDSDRENKMVMLNCTAPVILTHHFLKGMAERKKGGIVFLGSMVAFQSTPMMATYAATKAFNLLLGEALWYELKKYGIDVLALNPGGTNTEFQRIATVGTGPAPRTPQQVVETAFKALGRKPSVVDGALNKTMAVLGKFLPRKYLVSIAGKISGKLYSAKVKKV